MPTTLNLSPSDTTLSSLGEIAQLRATVLDQAGAALTGAAIVWSSSDELVATVSATGVVTAVANGTVSITAMAGIAVDTAAVTVAQVPDTITVVPDPLVLNGPGDTLRVRATVRDAGGSSVGGQAVAWSSSNEAVVTVDNAGLASAISTGTATIRATSGALSTVVGVTVTVVPGSITVSPTTLSFVSLGDTATVAAVVRDTNGVIIQNAGVVWSSSNAAVATVSAGLVTAVGPGNATVTATAGPVFATVAVSVVQVPSSITISPDPVVLNGAGDTLTIRGVVRDAGGSPIPGQTVTWSSGDVTVVTVSSQGRVTAVGVGTTTISAVSGQLSASVAASVTVTPASITLSPDSVMLTSVGDTARIVAVVRDANGNVITGASVSWSSSNTSVATVSGGLVTAVAFGTATVTASAGSVSATAKVVAQAPVQAPSFSVVVNEIFIRRGCTSGSCHGGGAGGMTLTSSPSANYAALVNVPSSADPSFLRVKPGDAFNSYLVMKLEGRAGARMPIGGAPLSSTDLGNIKSWIDAGAPNN